MRALHVGLILFAAAMVPVECAAAATAEVDCEGTRGCSIYFVAFEAEPGEANRVVATQLDDRRVRVRDIGAVIAAGGGCERVDEHEVVCGEVTSVRADLGDGDDEFSLATLPSRMSAVVDGGAGDDRIEAGGTLDGGGGRDTLIGSDSFDTLIDGDSVRAPDADVMDGGAGIDTVSYAGRRRPVLVDLARGGRAGERGEGTSSAGWRGSPAAPGTTVSSDGRRRCAAPAWDPRCEVRGATTSSSAPLQTTTSCPAQARTGSTLAAATTCSASATPRGARPRT